MENYVTDFKLHKNVPVETIEKYRSRVPDEMIAFWNTYGFGEFLNGYLKSVDPDEFQEILQQTSQRYQDAVVLFATAMGDLIIWSDGYVRLLSYRYGVLKTLLYTFEFFFQNNHDQTFQDDFLLWHPYPEARNQYGGLAYDECFGYTPLLGIGGPEKVENLKKVKLKEHILVITELMGPIE